ncbi:MAG: hypothetical protein NVSMB23_18280 [Myxococcales bacterium]
MSKSFRVAFAALCAAAAISSRSDAASETLLFSDDFATNIAPDRGLGPSWATTGLWFVNGRRAITDLDGVDRATLTSRSCADCRVEARVLGFGVPETAISARAAPNGDRYELVLLGSGRLRLRRWRSGVATTLGEAPARAPLSSWAILSLQTAGAGPVQLTAAVNGARVLSIVDATPQAIRAPGKVGFFTRNAGVWFGSFRLFAPRPPAVAPASGPPPAAVPARGSGLSPDAGPAPDGGFRIDAGPGPDGGSPSDAGRPGAAGSTVDGGLTPGAARVADAGPAFDGGAISPSGAIPDGGNAADAGALLDGGPPGATAVLFSDDFSQPIRRDDGLGARWTVSGLWFSPGGQAVTDLDGVDQALETAASCADCRVEARVLGYGVPETAISLRAVTPGDRYDAVLLANRHVRIRRVRAGIPTTLGEAPSGLLALNEWATLSLEAHGAGPVVLTASVNGVPRLAASDAAATAIEGAGSAGLWTTNAGVAFGAFRLVATAPSPPPNQKEMAWPFYRRDVAGTGSSPGPLSTAQAGKLSVAFRVAEPAGSDANPIVAGGKLYVVGTDGKLRVLDAATGAPLWTRPIGMGSKNACVPYAAGPVGAVAVVGQQVVAPGGDGRVYSFDKDTGALLWATAVASPAANTFLWSSIFPLHGKLYVGVATLFEPKCGTMPGRVVALDQVNGALLGTWWAIPNHGRGGGVWTQPAYDPRTNRLFLTTGTVADGVRPQDQPLAQAFVAIDPETMKTVDSYQPVPTTFSSEFDFGASPSLVDAPWGRHLVVAANKNGYVYALDRDRLANGVLWTTQISGAGASPDIGESTIVSAASANGMLFVGGGKTTDGFPGAIAALDPATGKALWTMHPNGFVLPALTAVGDVVVAGVTHADGKTGELLVLSQRTGAVLFTQPMAGRVFAEPTWANGRLYVVDDRGTVLALRP